MRKVTLFFVFVFFIISGCSTDDSSLPIDEVPQEAIHIKAVAADGQSVYQFSYNGSNNEVETTNLSEELGLGSDYLTLRQSGNTLTFYTFNGGEFSLRQKNVSTGAVQAYIDFYTNTEERSIVWGINNETSVFFGYYKPLGSTNLAVQNIQLDNLQGTDLSLEFNIDKLYQPLYHEGKLYITYRNSALEYKISIYDTATFSLAQTLVFGTASPSLLVDANGDLVIFKFSDTANVSVERRDIFTLEIVEEVNFEWNQRFIPGPINAEVVGDYLYYGYEYSQPFDFEVGPAILNINTGENSLLNLEGAIAKIEAEEEMSTYVVWQQYDPLQNVFLVSYGRYSNEATLLGGVLILSSEGEFLDNVLLPFVPTYFVK